ncbi:MAG: site-2 protease family protein [Clostridia bacterium]|nr:site-2 protease family protein [Clostridia bacterium]
MGILSGLQSDPLGTLISLLYAIPAILISLTLHEMAHGYVALKCGDPTAQMMGRLSFNPLHHLDPIGTLFMVLFGFGWARPVPVNPRNFRNYRRDDLLVSVAGVVMNLILFCLSMVLIVGVNEVMWKSSLWDLGYPLINRQDFLRFDGFNFYSVSSGENILFTMSTGADSGYALDTMTFNQYLSVPWLVYVQRFLMGFSRINLSLAIFNLLPIPPLDGYHVVNDIFLRGKLHLSAQVVRYLSLALMAVMFFTDIISNIIGSVMYFVQGGVVSALLTVCGLG